MEKDDKRVKTRKYYLQLLLIILFAVFILFHVINSFKNRFQKLKNPSNDSDHDAIIAPFFKKYNFSQDIELIALSNLYFNYLDLSYKSIRSLESKLFKDLKN